MSLCLEKVCRTCMGQAPTMLSLWKTDNMNVSSESPSILHKLVTLTTLNMMPNDGLPENICISCIRSLDEAYDFKQTSEHTDAILRSYLKDILVKQGNKPDIYEINLKADDEETLNKNVPYSETNLENDSLEIKLESVNQDEYLTTDPDEDEDNQSNTMVIEPIGEESSEEKNYSINFTSNEEVDDKNLLTIYENVPENSKIGVIMTVTKGEHSDEETHQGLTPESSKPRVNKDETLTITSSIDAMKFVCTKCFARFSRAVSLQRHQSIEDCSEALHECEICQRVYCRRRNLSEHMIKAHKKKLKCTKCSEEFESLIVLNNHLKYHSDQLKSDALLDFTSETKDNETNKVILKCVKCSSRFSDAESLDNHRMENKCTQCEICKKIYKTKFHLVVHLRKIHNQEIKCSECGEEFTRLRDLKTHMIRRHAQPKSGPSKPKVKPKVKTLKRSNKKLTICPICGKAFHHSYTIHMRRHNQIKPFKCTECDSTFVSNDDLKSHFRKHTGELPYVCEFCGAAFRSPSERTQHRRTHTGEKRYECGTCKKRFLALNTLKMHIRTHTGERPYACPVCDRKFARLSDMTKHRKVIHLGEKPYICNICSEGFRQSSKLKTHMKNHQVVDAV